MPALISNYTPFRTYIPKTIRKAAFNNAIIYLTISLKYSCPGTNPFYVPYTVEFKLACPINYIVDVKFAYLGNAMIYYPTILPPNLTPSPSPLP